MIDLDGLRVILEDSVQIDEGCGYHWFADMAQFATGELLTTASAVADDGSLPIHAVRVYLSTDQGRTWEYRYTVSEAQGAIKIARPDGDLLMVPGDLDPDPPGQWRSFRGSYVRYQEGGQRIVIESGGARFEDLPRDIAPRIAGAAYPGSANHGVFHPCGEPLEMDGRLLTTAFLRFQGDDLTSTVVVESDDEGRTWRYLSTAAGPEAVPDSPIGTCEPSMIQLETGELMCVMRVGNGLDWKLVRTYSSDGGRSWSPVDTLPAWSVRPRLLRLSNGVLLMSAGRPGIYLWLSTDPRGEHWQQIDLVAHHNQWAPDPGYTIITEPYYTPLGQPSLRRYRDQTTAYTSMVEIEPNRVLMSYDRVPFGWNPVPTDSDQRSRVCVLPLTVERT